MAKLIFLLLLVLTPLALLSIHKSQANNSWLQMANYQLQAHITLEEIEEDASGLAYDPVRQRLWLVSNDGWLLELDPAGKMLRRIRLQGFNDPEGLTWLSNTKEGTQLIMSEERLGRILLLDVPPETEKLTFANARVLIQTGAQPENHGVEGLALDPQSQALFAINEYYPKATFRINGNQMQELWRVDWFEFWHEPWDYAGLAYAPHTGNLLVVSDRSRDLREYNLKGQELAEFELNVDHPEGIALAPDGTLYICAEPNVLLIYKPANQLAYTSPGSQVAKAGNKASVANIIN